jgi:hypothetical protein
MAEEIDMRCDAIRGEEENMSINSERQESTDRTLAGKFSSAHSRHASIGSQTATNLARGVKKAA